MSRKRTVRGKTKIHTAGNHQVYSAKVITVSSFDFVTFEGKYGVFYGFPSPPPLAIKK